MDGQMMTSPSKSKKKVWIGITIAIVAVIAIVVGITLTIVFSKPIINLNDYIKVSYSSYDGYGTAHIEFDYEKMEKEHEQELRDSYPDFTKVIYFYDSVSKYIWRECVDVELSSNKDLSNGDVITLKWIADKDKLEDVFGCKFEFCDKKYTVSGLPEAKKVDVFKDIEIKYDGFSGNADATIINNATDIAKDMKFYLDNSHNLSNGDVITLSVSGFSSSSDTNYFMGEYGCIPMEPTKTITIESLPEPATRADQITDSYISSCKEYIINRINNDVKECNSNQEGMTVTVNSADYAGYYFLNALADGFYGVKNALYIMYKVNVTIEVPEYDVNVTREFYSGVYINNVGVVKNGDVIGDTEHMQIVSGKCYETYKKTGSYRSKTFLVHGYTSIESFCDEMMNDYKEKNYSHEDKLLR